MERDQVGLFANGYRKLYLKKHLGMTASNYERLEMQVHLPPAELEQCYTRLQEEAYDSLRDGKISSAREFIDNLEVAQHHPKLSVLAVAGYLGRFVLDSKDAGSEKELPRLLLALSSIYKVRFDLSEDTALIERILDRLAENLTYSTDLPTTCYALEKLKLTNDRLVDRLEVVIEEASCRPHHRKHLLFSTLDLYARLPQRYYPHRLNSFFMDALSSQLLNLN